MYINPLIEQLERKYPGGNREGILRLDMNENPGGLPLEVVESVKSKMTPEFFSTYPDKDPLINSLATFHGVSADNIAITDGSDISLKLLANQVLTLLAYFQPLKCTVYMRICTV